MEISEKKIRTVEDDGSGLKLVYTSGESDPYKLTSNYSDFVFNFSASDLEAFKRIIDAMFDDQ